jgi:poly-gamma-glutamate synthesis protein (capsule biosynthesis protein)
MQRIEAEIREAKLQADVVLVSIHSHEYDGDSPNVPAKFLETFSHRCIDAGAQVIIGHGPHELQGIELYNGGVIFYSIGNFIFQTETVSVQPWDAYANRKLPLDMKVGAYMNERSNNGTTGYCVLPEIWNAVMAAWTMEDDQVTEVQLYPVELGQNLPRSQKGVPVMNGSEETLQYLQSLSDPYGTKIEIKDGMGIIRVK